MRGSKVTRVVKDVGKHFPFVNREECLKELYGRLRAFLNWCESERGNIDSCKATGGEFNVCCGASGIGKTTFAVSLQINMFLIVLNE